MSKTILFIPEQKRLLLKYRPSDIRDPRLIGLKLETEGRVTVTYDDLLCRLDNIISMLAINHAKLDALPKKPAMVAKEE